MRGGDDEMDMEGKDDEEGGDLTNGGVTVRCLPESLEKGSEEGVRESH